MLKPAALASTRSQQLNKVHFVVVPIEKPEDILALAAQVYEDLSEDQIDFIEQHTRRREDFFGEETSA